MRGLKGPDLVSIMDFLYFGETNIEQENLESFLELAEELKLKGLTKGNENMADEKFDNKTARLEICRDRRDRRSCKIFVSRNNAAFYLFGKFTHT